MIDTHELKKRDLYLNKIVAFRDTEPVKVVTGIRRCGKSSLLKLMVAHLKETGIKDEQIIEMICRCSIICGENYTAALCIRNRCRHGKGYLKSCRKILQQL